jgi:hypothetical protein
MRDIVCSSYMGDWSLKSCDRLLARSTKAGGLEIAPPLSAHRVDGGLAGIGPSSASADIDAKQEAPTCGRLVGRCCPKLYDRKPEAGGLDKPPTCAGATSDSADHGRRHCAPGRVRGSAPMIA